MVEICRKTQRRLTAQDHDEIRYLLHCGYTIAATAMRMGASFDALRYRIQAYRLRVPVSSAEAMRLAILIGFRETNRKLETEVLKPLDYSRLCATQIRQAMALAQLTPTEDFLEEDTMSSKSDAARQRLLAMSDEEAINELRRVAGLENKSADPERDNLAGTDKPPIAAPVSDAGEASADAAIRQGLANMDVYGRTRRGEDTGGR